jgi:hypothetical protein
MAKTLCDWSKGDIKKRADKLFELVRQPRFLCCKCARVANTPKVLCKPRKLPDTEPNKFASSQNADRAFERVESEE